MKKLKFFGRFIFVINALVAFLLLISYLLPYVPPKSFSTLSVLSLGVPLLILLNVAFFVYWLVRFRKQMILSLFVLLLGWNHVGSLYKLSSSESGKDDSISILSYNVRLFNVFEWLPSKTVKEDILTFVKEQEPDILCLQEYRQDDPLYLQGYHNFNALSEGPNVRGGQVIFSKFPIINNGSLEFPNSFNNAIFADIVKGRDTIRVYNMHLQSAKINTEQEEISARTSGSLFKRVGRTFKAQQDQVELFLKHKAECPYKVIVTGDFNNTTYSYTYNKIEGDDLKDTFVEAGSGFGKTYNFKYFPLRIDFILADKRFNVNRFNTFNDIELSDHYPIKAILSLD